MKVITTKVNKGLLQKLQKNSADTGVNNYVQSFGDTTFRLLRHDLWRSLQWNISPETWVYSIQCLSSLSGAIRGSSREKLDHELDLESLQHRHWYRKLYKIFKENKHVYLFSLIPTKKLDYNTTKSDKMTLFHTKHNFFKHCFFHPLLLNGTS